MEDTHNTQVIMRNAQNAPVRNVKRTGQSKISSPKLKWAYAGVSVLIATMLWFGIDMKRMEDMSFDVEIEFQRQLPADWKFVVPPQQSARVVIRGTRQEISSIRKEELMIEPEFPTAALDGDVYDGVVNLLPTQVRGLPAGIEVQSVTPQVISVRLAKTMTKWLTVEAGDIVGTPMDGYAVGRVHTIDPPAMPISGSREFLAKIGSSDVIRTREFSVEGARGMVGGMVGLMPFGKDGETVEVPGMVYMTVELDEIPVSRQFETPFEVRALIDSPFDRYANLNISPPTVSVTVTGPKSVVDKMGPGEIVIYADIRDRLPAAPGEFNLKCKAITPSRVRVTKIEPDTVKWIARDGTAPPADAGAGRNNGETPPK